MLAVFRIYSAKKITILSVDLSKINTITNRRSGTITTLKQRKCKIRLFSFGMCMFFYFGRVNIWNMER